jgi:hypothetical protein
MQNADELATPEWAGANLSWKKERKMSTAGLRQSFTGSDARRHSEGVVARTIEDQTAMLPSDVFLWAAVGSIVGSLALNMSGRQHQALFVGQWAPTFLILGLYNKIVKVAGSDRFNG